MKSKIQIVLDVDREDGVPDSLQVEMEGNGMDMANHLPVICGSIIADVLTGMTEHGFKLPSPIAVIALGADVVNVTMDKIGHNMKAKERDGDPCPN